MKRLLTLLLALLLCCQLLPPAYGMEEETAPPDSDHRAMLAALYEADIASVRQALSLRLITCEELTAYYLERIERYDAPYNCFITLCDNALDVARERDAAIAAGEGGGTLFGIPVVVKDNIHYAGYPTTNGRTSRLDTISEENAAVVDYLLAEGAVIVGKTNMSTDAQNARVSLSSAAGETKNAYDPCLASGGSSGGSAVAASLNFAMAGLGTDTNSSLRYPAALNGCVSLRPTLGLLPRDGLMILNSKRDTPGAITRTVADQAIMLDAISGGVYGYAANLDAGVLKGMRIGVLKEFACRGGKSVDGEVTAAFAAAVEELRACGAEVVEVSLPNIFTLSANTFPGDSKSAKAKYYSAYQKLLADNNVSAVIFPTYMMAPQYSGKDADGVYHNAEEQPYITNCRDLSSCIGIPEISVPIGQHSRGAGIGMEIAADKNCEQLLLNIAYSYTARYDHRVVPEGAPDLYAGDYAGDMAAQIDAYLHPPVEAEETPEAAQTPPLDAEEIEETPERPAETAVTAVTAAVAVAAGGAALLLRKKSGLPR